MRDLMNWPVWCVAALGMGWTIYLMAVMPDNASVKDVLTIGVLFLLSIVLLETGARKKL